MSMHNEIRKKTVDADETDYIVLLLPVYMFLSIPIRVLLKRFNSPIPQNSIIVLLSAITGIIMSMVQSLQKYRGIVFFQPGTMLGIFLPIFITSTVYQMDAYIFKQCLPQALIICLFGVIITPLIFAIVLSVVLNTRWTYIDGVFAALATLPIQPIHNVILFKDLTKYRYLGTFIEAEALILTIPTMIIHKLYLKVDETYTFRWHDEIMNLLRCLLGGFLIGYIFGKIKARIMFWLYNDPNSALCVSIGFTYFTFYFCEYIIRVSGSLAILCLHCIVAFEKHRFTSDVDLTIIYFWGTFHYLFEMGTLIICIIQMTAYMVQFFEVHDLYGMIIMYFSGNVVRFMRFLIIGPLLNLMTYELNIKCLLVLGWCDCKGCLNLLLLLVLINNPGAIDMINSFLIEILAYTFLSYLITSTSMRLVLKLMGLNKLSETEKANLHDTVKVIMQKRYSIINILKINRYVTYANWAKVRRDTTMENPYADGDNYKVYADHEDTLAVRIPTICHGCVIDPTTDVSQCEMVDLVKGARMKILKEKKVSVIKQFKAGTINKNCLQILEHNFEIMKQSAKQTTTVDVNQYLDMRFQKVLVMLRNILTRLYQGRNLSPPTSNFRRLCFYVTMNVGYDYFFFATVIANVAFCIWNNNETCIGVNNTKLFHTLMWFFHLFMDFVVKVIGLSHRMLIISGIRNYFRMKWNWFTFSIFLLSSVNIYLNTDETLYDWIFYHFIPGWRTLAVIELIQFFYFLRIISSHIINLIDGKVDRLICYSYELSTALVHCNDDILNRLPEIIELSMVRDLFMKELDEERLALIKRMEVIEKERPWISITVKTKQAIRTSITVMEDALKELKSSGYLDNIEYTFIFKEIFDKQKFLRNIKFVQPTPPKMIFAEVPWMASHTDTIDYLYQNVQTVNWGAGDIIYKSGKLSKGIFIMVTGMLQLIYRPNQRVKFLCRRRGRIPIVDYLNTIDFDRLIDDIITPGNTIGEFSLLTCRPYDCTVLAKTPSKAYWLPTDIVKEAFKLDANPFNGLEARMWKCTIINLAVAIMMEIPFYQTYTSEQIKLKLERSFVPNLRNYRYCIITEMISDVILFEGMASDYSTKELYIAPMLIPRACRKLILPSSGLLPVKEDYVTKLLILPMGETKEDELMQNMVKVNDLDSRTSNLFQMHASTSRKRNAGLVTTKALPPKHRTRERLLNKDSHTILHYKWEENKEIINLDSDQSFGTSASSSTSELSRQPVILLKNKLVVPNSSESDDSYLREAANVNNELKPVPKSVFNLILYKDP